MIHSSSKIYVSKKGLERRIQNEIGYYERKGKRQEYRTKKRIKEGKRIVLKKKTLKKLMKKGKSE
ncbi:hypothetical protein M1614_01770 [Candidatus Marsarchaeota archaeon]|nr:hypothetical protein [Candidatus Marsarchaeota archaeon]